MSEMAIVGCDKDGHVPWMLYRAYSDPFAASGTGSSSQKSRLFRTTLTGWAGWNPVAEVRTTVYSVHCSLKRLSSTLKISTHFVQDWSHIIMGTNGPEFPCCSHCGPSHLCFDYVHRPVPHVQGTHTSP